MATETPAPVQSGWTLEKMWLLIGQKEAKIAELIEQLITKDRIIASLQNELASRTPKHSKGPKA